jgi:hypothetical protein
MKLTVKPSLRLLGALTHHLDTWQVPLASNNKQLVEKQQQAI